MLASRWRIVMFGDLAASCGEKKRIYAFAPPKVGALLASLSPTILKKDAFRGWNWPPMFWPG